MKYEHEGHRQRMYEKLLKESLLKTEEMEMILYFCVPRRNTTDLAHRLIEKFGSAPAVLRAPKEDLMQVKGMGENIVANLSLIGGVCRNNFKRGYDPFVGQFNLMEFHILGVDLYASEENEVLDIYLLNAQNRLIGRHRYTDENVATVKLDAKWLTRLLADDEVYGVVMVHNHPEGTAQYSMRDEVATRACQALCNAHGKVLCDHVIFSKTEVFSYYRHGKMEGISAEYGLDKLVNEKTTKEFMEKSREQREAAVRLIDKREKGQ